MLAAIEWPPSELAPQDSEHVPLYVFLCVGCGLESLQANVDPEIYADTVRRVRESTEELVKSYTENDDLEFQLEFLQALAQRGVDVERFLAAPDVLRRYESELRGDDARKGRADGRWSERLVAALAPPSAGRDSARPGATAGVGPTSSALTCSRSLSCGEATFH